MALPHFILYINHFNRLFYIILNNYEKKRTRLFYAKQTVRIAVDFSMKKDRAESTAPDTVTKPYRFASLYRPTAAESVQNSLLGIFIKQMHFSKIKCDLIRSPVLAEVEGLTLAVIGNPSQFRYR